MKLKIAISAALVLFPLSVFAAPQASFGEIRFSGRIVDSGCEVGRVGALGSKESRQVEVKPGLTLDVDTYRNACSHGALPLSVSYEALKTSSDKGIVIISYL